eukprot:651908-Lingulodinium_polyedra.AAC.1
MRNLTDQWATDPESVRLTDGLPITHAVWADNIYLFAKDDAQAEQRTNQLARALADYLLDLKEGELFFMSCDGATSFDRPGRWNVSRRDGGTQLALR